MACKSSSASDEDATWASKDRRYESYVRIHVNLDTIIWGNQAAFISITVLLAGALGYLFKGEADSLLDPVQSARPVLLVGAALYMMTWRSISRTSHWHRQLEDELMALEPDGYFHARARGRGGWKSAQKLIEKIHFGAMGLCVLGALFLPDIWQVIGA